MGNSVGSAKLHRGSTTKLTQTGGFEEPVEPLSKSGGTAIFVSLRTLSDSPLSEKGIGYFIGKDRSHAKGELRFYEKVSSTRKEPVAGDWPILDWMLDYAGLFRLHMREPDGSLSERDFIVMENLFHGQIKTRLIDVKMGSVTADKNWFGKTRFAAWRIKQIDKITNSEKEGFRMEGINNPPATLESIIPVFSKRKQTKKLMYQRLTASEFFRFFLDTTGCNGLSPSPIPSSTHLSSIEYSMLLHLQMVRGLSDLVLAVESVPVPQKWVGSSIALSFDCGGIPTLEDIASKGPGLRIKLIDWGRSEFTSSDSWSKLSPWAKQDRVRFWSRYRASVGRLLYEAARLYYERFIYASHTESLKIDVFDHDRLSDDDFVGTVTVPLAAFDQAEFALSNRGGSPVKSEKGHPAGVTLAMERVSCDQYRTEYFRLKIMSGSNMPRMDFVTGHCDPYVVVRSSKGVEIGRSKVCMDTPNPEWNDIVDVPITDSDDHAKRLWGALQPDPSGKAYDRVLTRQLLHDLFRDDLDQNSIVRAASRLRALRQPPISKRTKSMRYDSFG